jgi:signal peptidase I
MFRFSTVEVSGNSMQPTFNAGDWLVITLLSGQKHNLKVGKVFLIEDPKRPGVKLIKRLTQTRSEHGLTWYWVEGDNSKSTDSRDWGWLTSDNFLAQVLFRYKKAVIE